MLVGFERMEPESSKDVFNVNLSPDRLIITSKTSDSKLFLHSLAAFVQYLLDNRVLLFERKPIEDSLKEIVICGADISDYSLPFRNGQINMSWKEVFTILKHYGESLSLQYPDYMKDISNDLFQLIIT